MRYILGIDQGGTKTAAIMNKEGVICGIGYASGAYFPVQGIGHAVRMMEQAINQAMEQAGISMRILRA